jgi:hypothetical protein
MKLKAFLSHQATRLFKQNQTIMSIDLLHPVVNKILTQLDKSIYNQSNKPKIKKINVNVKKCLPLTKNKRSLTIFSPNKKTQMSTTIQSKASNC